MLTTTTATLHTRHRRLVSMSKCETELTEDSWRMACDLETARRESVALVDAAVLEAVAAAAAAPKV
jgi:hypothetical protein